MLARAENALGPLTTFVNNAGVSVTSRGDLLDVTPESYDRCQAVNARATFFLCQALPDACWRAPASQNCTTA
jgi:NAD(P)-dependent dehydrogenase (short-subunit alcohol dehydrogenase family)